MITPVSIFIKCVSAGDMNAIQQAWTTSRPNDEGNVGLDKIVGVDVPANEFARFNFEMLVPIMLREWICSFRDHTVWARTSRVENLEHWPIFDMAATRFEDEMKLTHLHGHMMAAKDLGDHQDNFRMSLPMCYMTTLSVSLSFRAIIKMLKLAVQEEHAALLNSYVAIARMFGDFKTELYRELFISLTDPSLLSIALGKYSIDNPISRMKPLEDNSSICVGEFIVVNLKGIPVALRAQLVRHRPLMIQDTFRSLMTDQGLRSPISTTLDLSFSTTVDVAISIITKRNCWIAQEDLWMPVVKAINEALGSGQHPLPCDAGVCPFERDNRLRLKDKDPAPPCPRFANIEKVPLSSSHQHRAVAYTHSFKPMSLDFWTKELIQNEQG